MIETVFISDLHLHHNDKEIRNRFNNFIIWAKKNTIKKIYILGDFFHAWAGDDSMNHWSRLIAAELNSLTQNGTQLFYMHGNRDFLLGEHFAKTAGWSILTDPTIVYLGNEKVLLSHGDRYCSKDTSHQLFRLLTRNRFFSYFFQSLPLRYRLKLIDKVRKISADGYKNKLDKMDVAPKAIIRHMKRFKVNTLIHGHTHKPGLTTHLSNGKEFKRYVLSDWDDSPLLLCYDYTKGFCFVHY